MICPGLSRGGQLAHSGLSVQSACTRQNIFKGACCIHRYLMYIDSPLGLFLFLDILYSKRIMLARILITVSVVSLIGLIVIINISTPSSVGPMGILAVFVLLYLLVLCAMTALIYWGSRLASRFSRGIEFRKPLARFSLRRSYYFASILALGPVMVLGMQSVGGAGVYELVLVTIFLVIGCIYIAKRTA